MDGSHWLHTIRTKEIEKLIFEEKKIGDVKLVLTNITHKAPSEEYMQGGHGRTDKN